ncbi:MAG: AAA family ATPase [Anaerolineales bacterium]|nr:AAA family ATPase [Anaerolineales bacterium]MBX3037008.1 AAA family ATPase [Anaerolineales bacterium]
MTNYQGLLQRLRDFVNSEFATQHANLERQWALPLGERVARGYAIEGLNVENSIKQTIRLSCQANESRFREGDFLVLHRGNPIGIEAMQVLVEYDDETLLEVSLQGGNPFFLQQDSDGWIADESMMDLRRFHLDALDEVADTINGRETILPMLNGDRIPQLNLARYERIQKKIIQNGLNSSQNEAIAQAYATDLYHLIQGPPGTGKTFVLANLVRLLVEDGQRVLVTALTHRAINNALNKVYEIDLALPVCKIGIESRTNDLQVRNYENFINSGFGDLLGGYAVGATPFALRSNRLSGVEFDVVIFDESSQVTLPLAIMGMLAGKKYIFIGDEHQLPPVTSLKSTGVWNTSVFGYLSGRGAQTMLTTTYRMNDVLAYWPSREFYDSLLTPDENTANRRLNLSETNGIWGHVLDPEFPAVFLDLQHRGNTNRSRKEAETVVELIKALLHAKVPALEIGVVVPYRAQGRAIRNLLRQALPNEEIAREIVVDTVERMQGQEREVILVSLTTSSTGFASQIAEFFFQPQRLNVAITRPRTKLIIVGSSVVLEAEPADTNHQNWVGLLRSLLENCLTITI